MKIFAATLLAAANAGKLCMFYCPMDLNEVCGSDGNTYGNPCLLSLENQCGDVEITKVHEGPCAPPEPEPECMIMCPMIFDPVCGTDGQTYGNQCALEAAVTCGETSADTVVAKTGSC